MKKIFFILVFVVSVVFSAEIGDANNSIQTVIEDVVEKSSIANNATVNVFMYDVSQYLLENKYIGFFIIVSLLISFYYVNIWIRIFMVIILIHMIYQLYGINMRFPVVDIMYSGFMIWSISLAIRSFHKYFEKFENKNLVTKLNLVLHIVDIIVFIVTIAFIVKSFNVQYIEFIATSLGIAIFFLIRKDLNNLKAFFMVSWDDFISIGDKIIVNGNQGRVISIKKFSTILKAEDGNLIKLPNSILVEGSVENRSKNTSNLNKNTKEK
jgi:small-conductance mechanosensitive channel